MSIKENIDLDINLNIDKHKLKDLSKQVTDSISAPREITVRISNADIDNNTILNQLDDVYSELENKAKNKKPISFNSPIFSVDKEQIKLTFNELDRSVHAFTNKLTQSRIRAKEEIDKIKKEFLSIKLPEANYENFNFVDKSKDFNKFYRQFYNNELNEGDKYILLHKEKAFDKIIDDDEYNRFTSDKHEDHELIGLDEAIKTHGKSIIYQEPISLMSRSEAIKNLKDIYIRKLDKSKLEQEKRDKLDEEYLKHLDELAKHEEDFDNNKITKDQYHERVNEAEDNWRIREEKINDEFDWEIKKLKRIINLLKKKLGII